MKLILTFCLVIFSIQFSEQVGYEGTHVYHDGDEIHEHHPLSPDVQQISRGHYKRPERNRTAETSKNQQNVQENNKNTEIKVDSNVTVTPNIHKNDTDSQNSSSKENSGSNEKEQLNENKTDTPPTSSEHKEDNKTENPKETTSPQNNNNTIDEINKDVPKIDNNNKFSSTTIPSELEHGQTQKIYENYPPAYEGITGKKYNGSINENSTVQLEHDQTQKIYETYPEAYEAVTGKKFNQTKSDDKSNKDINSLNVGQNEGKPDNSNNSQNKPKENNNNSIGTNIESEDSKKKVYDNYADAFEGITGKTYNGSRETNTTVQLEHGQTQKIYDTYPEAHEAITGKKQNITQNNEEPNKEVNSSNLNPDIDIRVGPNNSQNKATENNNNPINGKVESENGKNNLYDNYPDAFEGITGKTYNGSRENNSPIELEHGQTQKIYDTYPEAHEAITGKKPSKTPGRGEPNKEVNSENNNNSSNGKVESENGKNNLYDNYADAFERITGKTYNGSRENNSPIELEHGQSQKIYDTYPEAHEAITGKKPSKTPSSGEPNKEVNSENKPTGNNNNSANGKIESENGKNNLYDNYPDAYEGITGKTYNGSRENNSPIELEHGQSQKIYETYPEAYEKITGKKYDGSQPNKKPTSTNAHPADNTPGSSSQGNHSIISQENSSVPPGNEPTISANNGRNHESTDVVKQFVVNRGSSIIIQVGYNCNTTVINCKGQVPSTTNVINGTHSNKTSGGVKIVVNAIGKGNPGNTSGRHGTISVIVGSSKHQPAKQIPCPPGTSVKNVLLSQFKEKRSLPSL